METKALTREAIHKMQQDIYSDLLSQDLIKTRSREIPIYTYSIALRDLVVRRPSA